MLNEKPQQISMKVSNLEQISLVHTLHSNFVQWSELENGGILCLIWQLNVLCTLDKNFIFYIILLCCHLFFIVKSFSLCLRHILRIFYKKLLFCSNIFYVTKSVKPRSSHVMISLKFLKRSKLGLNIFWVSSLILNVV